MISETGKQMYSKLHILVLLKMKNINKNNRI